MNKLTFALVVALSSGYASASDFTAWGGDLDGHYEPVTIGSIDIVARLGGAIDLDEVYADLDGSFDEEHFSPFDTVSNSKLDLGGPFDAHADLDGYSEFAGDV